MSFTLDIDDYYWAEIDEGRRFDGEPDDEPDNEVVYELLGNDFPDDGQVVAGVITSVGDEGILVGIGAGNQGFVPMRELPTHVAGKARETLSVGDHIEAVVLDTSYGRRPILSVAMLLERLAWSDYPNDDRPGTKAADDRAPASSARPSRQSPTVRSPMSTPDVPDLQKDGERAVPTSTTHQLVNPVEFLQPGRRLLIDTNVFMDAHPQTAGGLKRLFKRGQAAILANDNPIVVPTKVVDELTKQSTLRCSAKDEERAASIRKAGTSLVFLESASAAGLVRKDLGHHSNPYADDLFLELFERFAGTYDMCLLTRDITIRLRVRLLAHRLGQRLLAGELTREGDIEIESDQALFEKAWRKYAKLQERVGEGSGKPKDKSEIATLKPTLDQFAAAFGLREPAPARGGRGAKPSTPGRRPSGAPRPPVFAAASRIKPPDEPLATTSLPQGGDTVTWESAGASGTLVLGKLLGEGGEGCVYEGDRKSVVKVFDKDHVTRHRREKIELLVDRGLEAEGVCIPSALVRNQSGDFVGYVMPKASGREFQRTIFNRRKFEKEFPNWKKADLVDICISFLEKVQFLHSMNVILGDINPKNLMVDDKKNVFIIDADSWQVEGYPCPVGTPMFTSPAMLGKTYSADLRTMEDELFAVATMLFMIVMTGQFPYIRTGTDGDMVQLIKEGNFAFQYENRNNKDQPDGDWKYMWSHIHKPVKDLFWHTFHKEGRRYNRRPTAAEWLAAFNAYKAYLGDKRENFDPMSNDVYPIRPKAYKPDTPIRDCQNCGRKNAIAGIWRDLEQEYFVPASCMKCKDNDPHRATASHHPPALTSPCTDCGASHPKRESQSGRCPACARKENNPHRATASHHLPALTRPCRDCGAGHLKRESQSGRCPACVRKDYERRARSRSRSLDPSRLCGRCGKPFISYGNVEWHQREGIRVPTTHKPSISGTYPAECVPRSTTAATKQSTSAPQQQSGAPQQQSSGNCFVATAVYGSYDRPELWVLRRWRDTSMLRTRSGRAFVSVYYATSPRLVDLLGDKKWFVHAAKGMLDVLVKALERSGFSADPYLDPLAGRPQLNPRNNESGEN